MSDDEVSEILEKIIDLGRLLGWTSVMAQDKNNQILGLYVGDETWINAKVGTPSKITH